MAENSTTGAGITAAPGKKIDRETAENEFIRYCDNNRIEHDVAAMNDDEIESFNEIKRHFIQACREGRAEVDGTSIKYKLCEFSPDGFKGEEIILRRPGGNAFSAMDDFKEKQNIHKLHAYMSAMTGKEVKYFSKIDVLDWKFISSMATLFLSL